MTDTTLSNEEIVFMMAKCVQSLAENDDDEGSAVFLSQLFESAVAKKLLVDDDSWYVFDGEGNDMNPYDPEGDEDDESSFGFATKGYCWLYWVGLGMPEDAPLLFICDPEKATANSGVSPEDIDVLTSDKVIHEARMHVDNAEIARAARAAVDGE